MANPSRRGFLAASALAAVLPSTGIAKSPDIRSRFHEAVRKLKHFDAMHPDAENDAALDAQYNDLFKAVCGLVDEIEAIPADSFEALRVKVEAVNWCDDDMLIKQHGASDDRIAAQVLRSILYAE
jgi:hypothetical protein